MIGTTIRQYREIHKISIEDLAKQTGLSEDVLRKIEDGAIEDPPFSTVARIANALNMNLNLLRGYPGFLECGDSFDEALAELQRNVENIRKAYSCRKEISPFWEN